MYKTMEYTYLIEKQSNNNLQLTDIFNDNRTNVLYILCYHINTESKYPFIQFMMEKVPYCSGLVKEQFILPSIIYPDYSKSIEMLVIERVKTNLQSINCDTSKINEEMYKGVIYDAFNRPYAMINITEIDISGLHLFRDSLSWFCLPSEIINQRKMCNIYIDDEIVELFTYMPDLSLLTNPITNNPFILPDVVYTGGEIKNVEFNSIFGISTKKEYENCGKYYYFYRSLNNAIKEGGWITVGGNKLIDKTNKTHTHNVSDRLLVDNDYGRYINGGINRYALFVEGKIYIEIDSELSLTDEMINQLYPEPCIIIGYSGDHEIKPDILVKEYNSFYPLSYHGLNKTLLGEKYVTIKSKLYMIN